MSMVSGKHLKTSTIYAPANGEELGSVQQWAKLKVDGVTRQLKAALQHGVNFRAHELAAYLL